jgi:purine-cytosine permease-like protein
MDSGPYRRLSVCGFIKGEEIMPQQAMIVGDNWLAILVAAIAFYAVGAVIYGGMSKLWMQLSGYTKEQLRPHMWKMALSPIMPILTAIGLAITLKLARVDNLAAGLVISAQLWLFFMLPARLYNFVYSPEKPGLAAMDAIHLLLGTLAAGAVISAWP